MKWYATIGVDIINNPHAMSETEITDLMREVREEERRANWDARAMGAYQLGLLDEEDITLLSNEEPVFEVAPVA